MSANSPKRIGIFSDIHGNLQAFQAVVEALRQDNVDGIYCCGDIVGYGGNPNECVELVQELGCPIIAGNHDHAALLLTDISYFNDVAKAAVLWTKKVLTSENTKFLQYLPLTCSNDCFYFVHASPKAPEQWNYILTMGEARINFEYFSQQFCFIGHSHQPFIIEDYENNLICPAQPEIQIKPGRRYLINVGSVGQPRDRNPKPAYVVCDLEKETIEIKRVEYDIAAAQNAIVKEGLPRELAERLAYGW
jgi:diadenosine tetraphosphatase ApaH/serine/threonine PP2A family protein phosphatase